MSKIIINSKISSSLENQEAHDIKAIKKDNNIYYAIEGFNVNVKMDDEVIINRYNDNADITLKFKNKSETKGKYLIKDLNIEFILTIKTKILTIKNNSINIKYDLYINDEFSDTFNYLLEWCDIK